VNGDGWFYGEIFGLWEIKREKVYNSLMPWKLARKQRQLGTNYNY
jgi:hypothetical protein